MKKFISLSLALLMLLSLFPVSVFAENEEKSELISFERTNKKETEHFTLTTQNNDDDGWFGGSGLTLTITAKDNNIIITRIEADIGLFGFNYGYIETNGTKRETGGVSNGDTVYIDNINSNTFSFSGENGIVLFKDIKVYYTHTHDFGNDGICNCGMTVCEFNGEHDFGDDGICICGMTVCEFNGEHTFSNNICVYCGAMEVDYLRLTSTGSTTIGFDSNYFPTQPDYKLEYALNDGKWAQADKNTEIHLNDKEYVCFRANGEAKMFSSSSYLQFKMTGTGTVAASGNVMSLMKDDRCCEFCFAYLFYGCTALTAAPKLPATTLAKNCYQCMFYDCTALTAAPALPATKLENECYYMMFINCTALTAAPVLPATKLATSCYALMFCGCTALTVAPELPATTLSDMCYYGMFYNCTALTVAPKLPATTLYDMCYYAMFDGCSALTTNPTVSATGSTISEGNIWIFIGIGVVAIGAIAVIVAKKKKVTK